jgi:cell division protein FtsZ
MAKLKNPPPHKASARRGKKIVAKAKKMKIKKPVRVKKILVVKKVSRARIVKKAVVAKKIVKAKAKKTAVVKKTAKKIFKQSPVKIKKTIVVKIKKHITRKAKVPTIEGFPAESLFKAKIKVIGIGGGGGSIVSEIGRSLEKATFVIADTDIRALKKKAGIKYFWFGEELTHGLGTGVNVDLAKQAAESAKEKISGFFKDQDIIIFVASLGGGLGSGATQIFAEAAREFGGITFGIFTMPFKFEGKNKQRIAQNALKSLRQSLNVSLVIPNEKIFKVIDESTPITNAFSTVNKSLMESLESLIDLIYNPGIINIDFADLRTILKGRGNSAFLNTVEESGKDRVEKICENIFKNPLLQSTNLKAEKILFNIVGSENLSMFEVEKISNHISNFNPKAKIIFGISKNTKLKNKIQTTILMTGGQIEEKIVKELPVLKVEPKKIIIAEKKKDPVVVKKVAEEVVIKKEKKKIDKPKNKQIKPKKPNKKINKKIEKAPSLPKKEEKSALPVPIFKIPVPIVSALEQKKVEVIQASSELLKKTIRRSGLEIKKAEEMQEEKKLAQEKEWEIPAFLRKVKFKG